MANVLFKFFASAGNLPNIWSRDYSVARGSELSQHLSTKLSVKVSRVHSSSYRTVTDPPHLLLSPTTLTNHSRLPLPPTTLTNLSHQPLSPTSLANLSHLLLSPTTLTYYTTMASQSKGKSSKTLIERPGINWREHSLDGSSLILSAVKEAAMLAPISELKKAACSALLILKVTQVSARKDPGTITRLV